MTYKAPTLTVEPNSPATQNLHTVYLMPKKADLPAELKKAIPTFQGDHPAVRGELGSFLMVTGQPAKIIFGIGAPRDFTPQEAAEWGEGLGRILIKEQVTEIRVKVIAEKLDSSVLLNFYKGLMLANHHVLDFKATSSHPTHALKKISVENLELPSAEIKALSAIVEGIAFTRYLVELPPNAATPEKIVALFEKALPGNNVVELEIWDEKKIKKAGMGLFEAVSRGSHEPPRLLIARYGKSLGPKVGQIGWVGKGVTFDTGGINLKAIPYKELLGMKKDMAGAAAVLGAMVAVAHLKPATRILAVTPLTTNAIGSRSIIPGDVVKSYAGKTVEIQNTDAEGRLILADALAYVVEQKVDSIVDLATLTGACVIALGEYNSGRFSNHSEFSEKVAATAEACGEPTWAMPMSPRYGQELKSTIADLSNMGRGREGGATLGAKFLENFVGKTPWVHLDIAGTTDVGRPAAVGGTQLAAGRMVHTLVQLARTTK